VLNEFYTSKDDKHNLENHSLATAPWTPRYGFIGFRNICVQKKDIYVLYQQVHIK